MDSRDISDLTYGVRAQGQQVARFQDGELARADLQTAPAGADLDEDIVQGRIPSLSRAGLGGLRFPAVWKAGVEPEHERFQAGLREGQADESQRSEPNAFPSPGSGTWGETGRD